jgi:hypothetical protein
MEGVVIFYRIAVRRKTGEEGTAYAAWHGQIVRRDS